MASSGNRSEAGVKKGSKNSKGNLGKFSAVNRINHGTVVTIGGPSMFAPYDAKLNDDIRMRLDILADIIRQRPNRICIRGHSSPEPLPADSPYRDQFELSFARARAVADYFITEKKISPDRIIVSAAGDTEQRMMTRDSKKQSQNHRVDVFLIDAI
jgi:chemotaxis protein MotB